MAFVTTAPRRQFVEYLCELSLRQLPVSAKKKTQRKTLNGRLPLEDSSDFDDSWTELIVTTRSFILDALRFFRFFRRFRRFFVFLRSERICARTNERTNERTDERTIERTTERPTERTDERFSHFFLATDGTGDYYPASSINKLAI